MDACFICTSSLGDSAVQCQDCDRKLEFCCASHLSLHHSEEGSCLPFDICCNDEYSRYLVADRDIAAGELVVKEAAVAWGPNSLEELVCLECLVPLDTPLSCQYCGYPLCAAHADRHDKHDMECEVFQKHGYNIGSTDDMESQYPCIAPLRCLMLKKNRPSDWKLVNMLMDHHQERKNQPDTYIERYRVDVINRLVKDLGDWSEEEVVHVLGVLDVNSIAVRGEDGPYRGRGIFPTASLMNHSCVCNTRNIVTGDKVESRATVDIPKGELITTHYASPLLPVSSRREKLSESWFFSCLCSRCQSPTDLGAYTSALKCQSCSPGYLLPESPTNMSTNYSCSQCHTHQNIQSIQSTMTMFQSLTMALTTFQSTGDADQEMLLSQLSSRFHPWHHLQLDLKLDLAQRLCRSPDSDQLDVSCREKVGRKVELCKEMLQVMDVLYPGYSKYRGLLLHELADCGLAMGSRDFHGKCVDEDHCGDDENKTLDKVDFVSSMKECSKHLEMGINCLRFDREGSFEFNICKKMGKMLETTKDFIKFAEFL